ncbi:MAG: hypothetical protein ACR2FG_04275 [Marmoricola sp.]
MPAILLPVSGVLAGWLGACLTGRAHPEEMQQALDTATNGEMVHLVTGLDPEPLSLVLALGRFRSSGAAGAALALPVPGDLAGLAGPPTFNHRALEAGEAVLVVGAGLGLVPEYAEEVVTWHAVPAERPRPLDPQEADGTLRTTLLETTRRLVELDVARWRPEIADVLGNLRHRAPAPLPRDFGAPRIASVDRAILCLEVVELARSTEGAAVSVHEIQERHAALAPLGRAARHALVAACSG